MKRLPQKNKLSGSSPTKLWHIKAKATGECCSNTGRPRSNETAFHMSCVEFKIVKIVIHSLPHYLTLAHFALIIKYKIGTRES